MIYVNVKYDQCERASDFSSALIYNDRSLEKRKKASSFKFSFYILVCQLPFSLVNNKIFNNRNNWAWLIIYEDEGKEMCKWPSYRSIIIIIHTPFFIRYHIEYSIDTCSMLHHQPKNIKISYIHFYMYPRLIVGMARSLNSISIWYGVDMLVWYNNINK